MLHGRTEFEIDAQMDVPTMMNMLMVVYNNVRDDVVMDEVAEAVSDAICMLGDMRKVAQQVAGEDMLVQCEGAFDPTLTVPIVERGKVC